MRYDKLRKPKFSEAELKVISDFWFNPDQTMDCLVKKHPFGKDKVRSLISHFIRQKYEVKKELISEMVN